MSDEVIIAASGSAADLLEQANRICERLRREFDLNVHLVYVPRSAEK